MTFDTNQVVFLSGCTHRIVQLWAENQIVSPDSISGHRRHYSAERVLQLCILHGLRRKGLSLQRLRKVNRVIAKAVHRSWVMWFATDGKSAQGLADPNELAYYLAGSKGPMLVIDIECSRQKIERLAEKLREKAQKAAA